MWMVRHKGQKWLLTGAVIWSAQGPVHVQWWDINETRPLGKSAAHLSETNRKLIRRNFCFYFVFKNISFLFFPLLRFEPAIWFLTILDLFCSVIKKHNIGGAKCEFGWALANSSIKQHETDTVINSSFYDLANQVVFCYKRRVEMAISSL